MDNLLNEEQIAQLTAMGLDVGMNVALAAGILIIGLFVAGAIRSFIRKAALKSERIDDTLGGFFASLAYYGILAVVWIAVLTRFGVQTTSLVAALGAATLAIGLALQGTLSNLAAGVMIVFFRPYKLGDFVEAGGVMGTVQEISLFTTTMTTPDNKTIIAPNGQIWGGVITNFSTAETRRVDITYSIDYADDIDKAMNVIRAVYEADARVLKDPEFFVGVIAHGASSVDIVSRAWVKASDYWGVYFDAMKTVKEALDANGLSIPYPHQVNINRKA